MSLEEQPRVSGGPEEGRRSASSRRVIKDSRSREQSRHSFASYTTCEEELPEVFPDMEGQCIIDEATVVDAREVTIETPKLPEKSALRASRLLEGLKINTTEVTTDPHDVYLSSEEDASSSADDFSDYDYDSTSEESEKSPVRRRSQEDTARAVSVIFIGKPCVIDLASGRRSVSPIRRPQTSSSTPSTRETSPSARPNHPPRHSSLVSTIDIPRESPSFLDQDPFATSNYRLESTPKRAMTAGASPRVPKAPTAAFQRFQKSLSLVRKRSRPNLKDAGSRNSLSWTTVSASTTDLPLTLNTSHTSKEEQRKSEEPSSAVTTPPRTPQMPVTYNDIVRSAKRNSSPRVLSKPPPSTQSTPPMSPVAGKRGLLSGLNMNRRRSLRIKP
ncbi:hypothetical protein F4818DRAFT_127279 [Hypoxylon cercidicola]|nr:hypothetical protein F4818DRAFT_127279 [Hypoxylon cercidicola]